MVNSKVSPNSKIYTFCTEPRAFSPVIEKLDELAIEQHTSRSRVIANILFDHFGISYDDQRRSMDYSETWKGRMNKT